MQCFSPFFLLISGLSLSLHDSAQGSSFINGSPAARQPAPAISLLLVAVPTRHSSQLPAERRDSVPVPTVANPAQTAALTSQSANAAEVASKLQLRELLETIQAQQQQLDVLQAETEAAIRPANRAEAATVAFEQRLRQLEAASRYPGFWR